MLDFFFPKVRIVAEIGINHNGKLENALELIKICKDAGCDYVKFQKREPDICVPEKQKNVIKENTPWGKITYLDYKKRIEFGDIEYDTIYEYCKELNIKCFASVWDKPSVNFMTKYTTIAKIPSAKITDIELCKYAREKFKTLIISTGMSTEAEVITCIKECNPDVIMHTNSTYPCPVENLNLNYITYLKDQYCPKEIGYSGHEFGLVTTFATIPLGVTWVERHVTLDRNMWGSDQLSSIEPIGIEKLVKGIRDIEKATMYPAQSRIQFMKELEKRDILRG